MNKVQIIVDSTVDLTPELYKANDMLVLPLSVNFGEEVFQDGVTITPDEVYKRVDGGEPIPSTAAISPATFSEAIEKALNDGKDVIYVGLGSKLSTTYQNFKIASADFEDRVFAIDSACLSSGTGLLALKMAKLRDEGKSAKEIYEEVNPLVEKVSAKFVLEKLDYMRKGGRCSSMAAIFGSLLHIHPILKMVDGKLVVEKKPRGPMKVAYNEMINELKADLPNVDMDNIMITSAGIEKENQDYLYNEVAKLVDPSKIRITRAGCVVSAHCGFGTVGILYIKK